MAYEGNLLQEAALVGQPWHAIEQAPAAIAELQRLGLYLASEQLRRLLRELTAADVSALRDVLNDEISSGRDPALSLITGS